MPEKSYRQIHGEVETIRVYIGDKLPSGFDGMLHIYGIVKRANDVNAPPQWSIPDENYRSFISFFTKLTKTELDLDAYLKDPMKAVLTSDIRGLG
ncbi:hypothetical protein EPN87_03100 [archaeon]|nr:MAG: hypothetical protein EPN87_03100 [archaeon]